MSNINLRGDAVVTRLPSFLFESGYKFSAPVNANVSVEVVVTRKSNTIRNFQRCSTMSTCFDQLES